MSIPKEIYNQIPKACKALEKSFLKRCPNLSNNRDSVWKLINNKKPSSLMRQKNKRGLVIFVYAVEDIKGKERFAAGCLPPCIFVTRSCLREKFKIFGYPYRTYVLSYVMHHELFHMFDKKLNSGKTKTIEFEANWEAFRSVVFPFVKKNSPFLLDSWAAGKYPRASSLFDPSNAIKMFLRTPSIKPVFVNRLKKICAQ